MNQQRSPEESNETAAGPRPSKPAGQSWESYADSLISRAQAEGAFDNLPGAGKPLPGLDEPFDPMWWARSLMKREQLAFAPGPLELQRKVEKALEAIGRLTSEAAVRQAVGQINDEIRRANASHIAGPSSNVAPLDEASIVRRWRSSRR